MEDRCDRQSQQPTIQDIYDCPVDVACRLLLIACLHDDLYFLLERFSDRLMYSPGSESPNPRNLGLYFMLLGSKVLDTVSFDLI